MPQNPSSSEQEESRRYGQLQIARMQMAQQQAEAQASSEQGREGMGFGTFLFFLIPSVIADIIDFVTAGTIGWVIGMVVDGILLIGLGFSKNKKKSQVYKILAGLGLETVLPVLGMLPFRTVFVIWAYASEKPKVQRALGRAASAITMAERISGVKKADNSDTL